MRAASIVPGGASLCMCGCARDGVLISTRNDDAYGENFGKI